MCHIHLSQALKQGVRLGMVSRNIAESVSPPRAQRTEMKTWDTTQARQFMNAAQHSTYGPIWLVAPATGMRRGELLGLRWQDVDFEHSILSVRQTVGVLHNDAVVMPPKSKSSRRDVAVSAELTAYLRDHKRRQNEHRLPLGDHWSDHDLVFASAGGGPIHPNNLRRDFDRWITQAGVPPIRIHDLRHTHVTLALKESGDIKAVSERVGHADISTTLSFYAHVLPEQHLELARKVGAALFGPIPQEPSEALEDQVRM